MIQEAFIGAGVKIGPWALQRPHLREFTYLRTVPLSTKFDTYFYPHHPMLHCENGRNRTTITPDSHIAQF